ncbi:MAG TPA: hypothetical protein VN106_04185 [Sphingomicrobium sp.]|nr:hypothetical protein [Sphingomicrobium sp.]
MADNEAALPEGTDTVIAGASKTGTVTTDATLVAEREIPLPSGDAEIPVTGSGSAEGGLADRLRSGRERLTNQAGDRARGLLTQGLEKSAEALASVGRMVGDTATGLDERLGNDYGDYARRAASAIDNAANSIASKDPDELIDDTRSFVRNSPGVALAGAAVVGFVVARLLKSGLSSRDAEDGDDRD